MKTRGNLASGPALVRAFVVGAFSSALFLGAGCNSSSPPAPVMEATPAGSTGAAATAAATAATAAATAATSTATAALPVNAAPKAPFAGPMKPVPPATLERAGAATCTVDSPTELAVGKGRGAALGVGANVAFGAAGGLVIWQTEDGRGEARPIGTDGRPTGPGQSFPVEKSFFTKAIVPFEGGFALLYRLFDVDTLGERHFIQVLSTAGEPRGPAVPLDIGEHYFEGTTDAASGRFIVFGGPNQAKDLQSSRMLIVRVSPAGDVHQERVSLPIKAPNGSRPAFSFAVNAAHWAFTIQVPDSPMSGDGGSESLVVDGVLHPLHSESASAAGGLLASLRRYQLAWNGDDLAIRWAEKEKGSEKDKATRKDKGTQKDKGSGKGEKAPIVRYARLSRDGQLEPEPAGKEPPALRRLFEERVEASYISGGGIGTLITRFTLLGADVGEMTKLDGVLPDVGKEDVMDVHVQWSGDRFVFAYAPSVAGMIHLRVAALRCDAAAGKARAR